MPTRSIFACTISLLLLAGSAHAQRVADTAARKKRGGEQGILPDGRQLRIGIDLSRPLIAALDADRVGFELAADYSAGKSLYYVAEGGWGRVRYSYPDLSYTAAAPFLRVGVDKGLLVRISPTDWDGMTIGARYGLAVVSRREATYTTVNPVWGSTAGTVPAETRAVHWVEVTAGARLEVYRNVFAGWNVRGKALLKQNVFSSLRPASVPGFGAADRNTAFDFSLYIHYAFRWSEGTKRPDAAE